MEQSFEDEAMDFTLSTPTSVNNDDSTFKSPKMTMSLRERKRKQPFHEESTPVLQFSPKRGRPKGSVKKKVTEKPSTDGTSDNQEKAVTSRPQKEQIKDLDQNSLCAQVRSSKNINLVVEKWLKKYEEDPESATVQFLQLFVDACGCRGTLDSNMIHTMEYKAIIERLSDEFPEDMTEYPLIQTTPTWRRFRSLLSDFITVFVVKAKSSAIYDVTLMDGLIQLLTGMADNPIRAFRHTATFSAMKLSSALVDIVVELVDLKEKNRVQIDTEKAKLRHGGTASTRLEQLIAARADFESKMDELCSMVQYIFKSVFVHRYRDVVSDIRSICIFELGAWMRVYPDLFLDDTYLKYIGWSLSDKNSEVRLKCLDALLPLFENTEIVNRLELFTSKFKERIASIVRDDDTEVAVRGCRMMTSIYRAFRNMIETEDCVQIYENVFSSNRPLAVAAAEFVNAKLLTSLDTSNVNATSHNELNQTMVDLIEFYKLTQVHQMPHYLVDALIEVNPIIKSWPVYINMLLSDEFDDDADTLVQMMCAAVTEAATGEYPAGRGQPAARKVPTKDPRFLAEERERLTAEFIPFLPRLLSKFIADQKKTADLISIFLHFQLEYYISSRQEHHLDEFLQVVHRVIEQHSDDENMVAVAKVLAYLNSESEFAIAQITDAFRQRTIDEIVLQFQQFLGRVTDENEPLDEEDEASLLASFRKVVALAGVFDLSKYNIWEKLIELLKNNRFERIQNRDIAEKAVLLIYEMFIHELNRPEIMHIDEQAYERLKEMRNEFLSCVKKIIANDAVGVENAYLCMCDVLLMLNHKFGELDSENEYLRKLVVLVDKEFMFRVNQFAVENVFVHDDNANFLNLSEQDKIKLLHKRRNILVQNVKLIVYGVLPIVEASHLLRYYTKFYNDYGDILKQLLSGCREIDKFSCAKALVNALKVSFKEIKGNLETEESQIDPASEDFATLKELAKRFAQSFGNVDRDYAKVREALVIIHKEGVAFAMDADSQRRRKQPKISNISFLEVLTEFSPKLKQQDKNSILKYLDTKSTSFLDAVTGPDDPQMASYLFYKESLKSNVNLVSTPQPTEKA